MPFPSSIDDREVRSATSGDRCWSGEAVTCDCGDRRAREDVGVGSVRQRQRGL